MSLRAMNAVWMHSDASGNDFLTLLAIADNANDDGFAFPSYPHLAAKTRLSRSTMLRCVSRLLDTDELALVSKGNRGQANTYAVNVHALESKPHRLAPTQCQSDTYPQCQSDTPPSVTHSSITRHPQPPASQPTTKTVVADATSSQLFETGETPGDGDSTRPDPLVAAVQEVWDHHVALFQPERRELSASREKAIRKGFREVMAGREEPTREDIDYLKLASDGLKVWREKKQGDTGVSALYSTYPGGKPLGDQLQFFVDQARSGGTSASPKVPSVLSGTISARKREVVDMLAYPDSPDHKQRGLAAMDWLKEHVGVEPILDGGALRGWQPV